MTTEAQPHGRTAPRSAIIVDDDASIRALLRDVLALASADVVGEALNGSEAIELVRKTKPELVVLDIEMPVMSGEQAYPLIREAVPEAQVVVFSIREPGEGFPGAVYVSKDASMSELLKALSGL